MTVNNNIFSVREIEARDIELLAAYWLNADKDFLEGMGADINKIPPKEQLRQMLLQQLTQSPEEKQSYAIIWLQDGTAIGHCNINKIIFGQEAYMHLHIWNADTRKKGIGTTLVKMALPYFFEKFHLKNLYSEPYALNPAPNRTLEKAGFQLVKEYITTPGYLNFEQPVKLWQMSYDSYRHNQ